MENPIDKRYDNPYKVRVQVNVDFDPDGNVTPNSFVWEDGKKYDIDRIVDIKRAASLRAGGSGLRYTVRVLGKETFLFRDGEIWFMERKIKGYNVLACGGIENVRTL